MLILIEGMDFSGKSTVTPLVVDELEKRGYDIHHSEGGSLAQNWYRDFVLGVYHRSWIPRWFAQCVHHSVPFVDRLTFRKPDFNVGKIHLQQGYIERVIAYDEAVDNRNGANLLRRFRNFFVKFDLKILIRTDLEVRIKRYKESGRPNAKDDARFLTKEGLERFIMIERVLTEEAKEAGYIFLDNTNLTIEETKQTVLNIIVEYLQLQQQKLSA